MIRYFSNEDLLNRVPKIFLVFGVINAGLQILGLLLMKERQVPVKRLDGMINETDESDNESESDQYSGLLQKEKRDAKNSLGVRYLFR